MKLLLAPPPRLDDPLVHVVADFFATMEGLDGPGPSARGYLAGGVAVRCYVGVRATDDVDMFFQGARVLVPTGTTFVTGEKQALVFDHQYTPDFGLLHPDFVDRAVPLVTLPGRRLRLWVLHPVDLALTKVMRFAEHDQADIKALASTRCFDAEALLTLGEGALGYAVGNLTFARANLRDAAELVRNVTA
jgi:hypothetical protein